MKTITISRRTIIVGAAAMAATAGLPVAAAFPAIKQRFEWRGIWRINAIRYCHRESGGFKYVARELSLVSGDRCAEWISTLNEFDVAVGDYVTLE